MPMSPFSNLTFQDLLLFACGTVVLALNAILVYMLVADKMFYL